MSPAIISRGRKTSRTNKWFNIVLIVVIVLTVIAFGIWYVRYRREMYDLRTDRKLLEIRDQIRPIAPEVVDRVTFYMGKRSYTINKSRIYLCMKDENGEYYNDNMLIYVALHELAHVMCPEIGHTDKFHQIFSELLEDARRRKIYDPSQPIIMDYCNY